MNENFSEPTDSEVDELYARLDREAKQGGYFLNQMLSSSRAWSEAC